MRYTRTVPVDTLFILKKKKKNRVSHSAIFLQNEIKLEKICCNQDKAKELRMGRWSVFVVSKAGRRDPFYRVNDGPSAPHTADCVNTKTIITQQIPKHHREVFFYNIKLHLHASSGGWLLKYICMCEKKGYSQQGHGWPVWLSLYISHVIALISNEHVTLGPWASLTARLHHTTADGGTDTCQPEKNHLHRARSKMSRSALQFRLFHGWKHPRGFEKAWNHSTSANTVILIWLIK